ncbi:TPA: ead/Ea22-like family protein [Citrobacter koseri]|nr:ead/Ea22-like family protein [Citrobacter koseri]
MSNIDKRALREAANAANAASWGDWESYKAHKGARGYEVKVGVKAIAQHCLKVDSVFIAAANPATVLALLDELEARDKQVAELVTGRLNLQWILNVYVHAYEEAKEQIAKDVEIKARLCRESNSLFDRLRAAEKRIAEMDVYRARRVSACIAACEGISTENLVNNVPIKQGLRGLNARIREADGELEALRQRIAELEARAFNPAILDVIAERQRQQSVEGWTPEHDDEHCNGELAMAAVCYINETGTVNRNGGKPWGWPWEASWWKPKGRRRNLVKSGALILAEIERIDRAAGIQSIEGEQKNG